MSRLQQTDKREAGFERSPPSPSALALPGADVANGGALAELQINVAK
jgi:hypothetical protein